MNLEHNHKYKELENKLLELNEVCSNLNLELNKIEVRPGHQTFFKTLVFYGIEVEINDDLNKNK